MKKLIVISATVITILFSLSTKTVGQIRNGSFEIWDSIYPNVYSNFLDTFYGIPGPSGGIINSWSFLLPVDSSGYGISQTTDIHSGNYSLILHNWYNYARQRIYYHDSLSYRPLFLQGYFKFIKGGTHSFAQGESQVTLTRFNGTSTDTIALGSYLFDTTASYTPFQVTLNYVSLLNPDSIRIFFINSNNVNNYSTTVVATNLLYLDDLSLSNSPLEVETVNSGELPVSIFPNPVSDKLTVTKYTLLDLEFTVYNLSGDQIIQQVLTDVRSGIDLSGLSKGIYFYKVCTDNNVVHTGKLIKQ